MYMRLWKICTFSDIMVFRLANRGHEGRDYRLGMVLGMGAGIVESE